MVCREVGEGSEKAKEGKEGQAQEADQLGGKNSEESMKMRNTYKKHGEKTVQSEELDCKKQTVDQREKRQDCRKEKGKDAALCCFQERVHWMKMGPGKERGCWKARVVGKNGERTE